jgi:hypothetical protein
MTGVHHGLTSPTEPRVFSKSWAWNAEQGGGSAWLPANGAEPGCDVGLARATEQGDGGSAPRGHDPWSVAGTDLTGILAQDQVPHGVPVMLDRPMSAPERQQLGSSDPGARLVIA